MDENSVIIQLKPSLDSTISEMEYDLNDDIDSDAILYQQGYNMQLMEIYPGGEFEIDRCFEAGYLDCQNKRYELITIDLNKERFFVEESNMLKFPPGNYFFHEDGSTIEQLS